MPIAPPTTRVPGWLRVLDALLEAPDRTLTNVELGELVQTFHQRISDLGHRGFVVTPAVRVGEGYYAYRLVGALRGSEAAARLPMLATFSDTAALEAVAEAVADIKANPPARREPIRQVRTHTEALAAMRLRAERAEGSDRERVDALRVALADVGVEGAQGLNPIEVIEHAVERIRASKRQPRHRGADRGPSGPQLMRQVLEQAARPVHSKVLAARVMSSGGSAIYKGKTPEATMAAQLATSSKEGGEFVRTEPGCFGLREWHAGKLALEPVRS